MPPRLRYSCVTRRMWNDDKFRKLSAPPPNGQTLWLRLLTGPELGVIPGLFAAREGGLADALGWPLEGFREAMAEVMGHGIGEAMAKADWEAGLVWVPNAVKHNPPASLNVVRGWGAAFQELPDSPLKAEAYEALMAYLMARGEAWAKAWAMACPKPRAIQEQEQDLDPYCSGGSKDQYGSAEPAHQPPPPPEQAQPSELARKILARLRKSRAAVELGVAEESVALTLEVRGFEAGKRPDDVVRAVDQACGEADQAHGTNHRWTFDRLNKTLGSYVVNVRPPRSRDPTEHDPDALRIDPPPNP